MKMQIKTKSLFLFAPRTLIALLVMVGVFNVGTPRARGAVQGPPSLKTESQVKSEATLYDAAIREIGRIETIRLTTADEFTRVKAIIERHAPNLKFIRSKLVALALNDATLIAAARTRTSTTKLAQEFAVELAQNPESIFRLSGGAVVKDKIGRSFQTDVSMFRRVSEQLKRAASEFKPAGHHAVSERLLPPANNPIVQREGVNTLATIVVASLVLSAVMITCPPLGIALSVLATVAAGSLFGVTAVTATAGMILIAGSLLTRVGRYVGTNSGNDQLADCLQRADATYQSCLANHPLIAIVGGCLAEYLVNAGACLIFE